MDGMNINNIANNLIHTWTLLVYVTQPKIQFFFVLV